MTTDRQAREHRHRLEAAVLRGLRQGPSSVARLTSFAPGAWPPEIRAAAEAVGLGRLVLAVDDGGASRPWDLNPFEYLPVPHPVDGEWRFTSETASWLAAEIRDQAALGTTPVLIGTPTVFAALDEVGTPAILFERSVEVSQVLRGRARHGRVSTCDVARGRIPDALATVTLADPPWYPSAIRAFLWAASRVTAVGGRVLVCIPPILARPSAGDERRTLLRSLPRFSLELVAVEPGAVRYSTPPFERAALLAAGVSDDLPDWRVGDLLVVRRSTAPSGPRPTPPAEDHWAFASGGKVRIAFRRVWGNGDPRLMRFVPGDVLPSVSRRDPRCPAIRVWTSENRVFGCGDPGLAAVLAGSVMRESDATDAAREYLGRTPTSAERRQQLVAYQQLVELVGLEAARPQMREVIGAATAG